VQPGRGLREQRRKRLHEFVYVQRERAFPLHDRLRPSPSAPPVRDCERRRLHRRGNAHGLRSGRGLFSERGVRIGRSAGDLQHVVRLQSLGPLSLQEDVSRRRSALAEKSGDHDGVVTAIVTALSSAAARCPSTHAADVVCVRHVVAVRVAAVEVDSPHDAGRRAGIRRRRPKRTWNGSRKCRGVDRRPG